MRSLSLACCLLVLCLSAPLEARQTPRKAAAGLVIEGETLVVVTKLPFSVVAPAGAKLYFWDLPAGWKHDASRVSVKNTVTVSEAPEGSAVVSATAVDKDFTPSEYRLTVNVGKVPAPPPPPPGPDSLLTKALKLAYASESDPARATQAKALAALYRQGGTVATDATVTTWGRLFEVMSVAAKTLGVAGKLPAVQAAIQAEVTRLLPRSSAAPLDQDGRVLAAQTFARVAASLEEVLR